MKSRWALAGPLFACEQADIWPDFLCLGRGLTAGYLPLSVVMTTEEIYQAFYGDEAALGFLHSYTHAGNALACGAAPATLDISEQDEVIAHNRFKAKHLNQAAAPIACHPKVENFRNCEIIRAFEVKTEDSTFPGKFFQAALVQELSLRPLGDTVYFMPPNIISPQEMDLLIARTLRALDSA